MRVPKDTDLAQLALLGHFAKSDRPRVRLGSPGSAPWDESVREHRAGQGRKLGRSELVVAAGSWAPTPRALRDSVANAPSYSSPLLKCWAIYPLIVLGSCVESCWGGGINWLPWHFLSVLRDPRGLWWLERACRYRLSGTGRWKTRIGLQGLGSPGHVGPVSFRLRNWEGKGETEEEGLSHAGCGRLRGHLEGEEAWEGIFLVQV